MKELALATVRGNSAVGDPFTERPGGHAGVGDCLLHQHPWGAAFELDLLSDHLNDMLSYTLSKGREVELQPYRSLRRGRCRRNRAVLDGSFIHGV
jgi:hypothetical protein